MNDFPYSSWWSIKCLAAVGHDLTCSGGDVLGTRVHAICAFSWYLKAPPNAVSSADILKAQTAEP